ncbi:MAG: hypothetical protein JRH20_10670 [Deltaproteobacteria bacterium]|nr:hypothetical protein [Deltaproteobacteria bacterium]
MCRRASSTAEISLDQGSPWRPEGACAENSACPNGKVCSRQAPGCVDPVCGPVDPDGCFPI